jgi:hypothetical protein
MIHTRPCNCAQPARLGDATFSDWLAANPDQAAQLASWQNTAPRSDVVLGPVDPATGQYASYWGGPGPNNQSTPIFAQAPTGYTPPAAPASLAAFSSNTFYWFALAALAAWLVFEIASPGTPGRKRR